MEIDEIERELAALRADLDELRTRFSASPKPGHGDYAEAFREALQEKVRREREEKGSPAGVAVAIVNHRHNRKGSNSTHLSIVTVDEGAALPDDDKLAKRHQRLAALASDPLILPIFRHLLRLVFEEKPMQATTAELGVALGRKPEEIEAILRPVVAADLIYRGLAKNDEVFYEWDGGTLPMALLVNHWPDRAVRKG
jgi:hypothetical protein